MGLAGNLYYGDPYRKNSDCDYRTTGTRIRVLGKSPCRLGFRSLHVGVCGVGSQLAVVGLLRLPWGSICLGTFIS